MKYICKCGHTKKSHDKEGKYESRCFVMDCECKEYIEDETNKTKH